MVDVEIFSAKVCPYAQRTRITLREKGVEFSLTEIDLTDKPDWFEEISPYSKVPVIRHAGNLIYESSVINEYLEEVYPDPPLMPTDPYERAWVRVWIDYANTTFIQAYYALRLAETEDQIEEKRSTFCKNLRFMEQEGMSRFDGPFWLGKNLSLADVSFYPFFERLPAITEVWGLELPADCPRLAMWAEIMAGRETVISTANSTEFHVQNYRLVISMQEAAKKGAN